MKKQSRGNPSNWIIGSLAAVCVIGLGSAVVMFLQSGVSVETPAPASAARELDEIRERLGAPYFVLQPGAGGNRIVAVRPPPDGGSRTPIRSVHGMAWTPRLGRLVRVVTPYWVFKAGRWKTKAVGLVVRPFQEELDLDFDLPDLDPLGPALVLDAHYPDGHHVMIWTE